jgi:hypothetical protein
VRKPWRAPRAPSRGGKYVPPKKGLARGGEEHAHRPAARAGEVLHGRHIDGVDVGPLLAVHLDADVVRVEVGGDLLVLERLALHDVAPVAGRVAHREEHGPSQALRIGERLLAPGIPVHGVVRVLEEIRAGLEDESVRELRPFSVEVVRAGLVVRSLGGERRFELHGEIGGHLWPARQVADSHGTLLLIKPTRASSTTPLAARVPEHEPDEEEKQRGSRKFYLALRSGGKWSER